jgi:phosphate transport system substrate-binding protein
LDPWLAIGLVVIVVAASIGLGELTGWAVGPRETNPPGLFGVQNCVRVPSAVSVLIPGAVSAHADGALVGAFLSWGREFSNSSGECVHIEPVTSWSDAYTPDLAAREVDFGATGALPNSSDLAALGSTIDLVPEAVVPLAIMYNLPGLPNALRLDGSVLAGLYDGAITSWNNSAVTALNPGVDLSSAPPVTALHRSDPADSNLPFTTFLAESNATWNASIGEGSRVSWPGGVAVGSTAQMAADLATIPGAVGYLEADGGTPANASDAMVENPAGSFVPPTGSGATAAAAALENSTVMESRDWGNLSLIDAPGTSSYPITYMAYVALFHDLGTAYSGAMSLTNASWLVSFLWWLGANTQSDTGVLGLGALPSPLVTLNEKALENLQFRGTSILEGGESGGGGETGEF